MSGRGRFGARFGGRGRGRGRGGSSQPSQPSQPPQPPPQPPPAAPSNVPPSWGIYFPELTFSEEDRRAELVATLARFFSSEIGFELVKRVRVVAEREVMLELDYDALKARADIPDLFAALEMAPAEGLPCLRAAVHEVVFNSPLGRRELPGVQVPAAAARVAAPPRVDVRLVNVPDSRVAFGELRSRNVGRLVSVRGTVTRVSPIKPLVVALDFACEKCEATQTRRFADGKYREPEACVMQGCRGRKFAPDHDSVKCVDAQRVRIQELAAELAAGDDDARAPRFAELELQGSLCDACEPGEVVTALGVVETTQVESSGGAMQRQRDARMYDIYLNAVSVVHQRGAGEAGAAPGLSAAAAAAFRRGLPDLDAEDAHFGRTSAGWLGVPGFEPDVADAPEMSPSDLEFIVRFTEECAGEQFKHLVHSLCPTIFGQDMVKAGALLSLFGGVRKKLRGSGELPVRGSIHCLVVGDPGLGKSQLLKAASGLAPRGMYVSGRSVSKAGLTATVVKDAGTGGYAFEAGAMVLSDGGVCCIDEFDKMPNEHTALLEAMEQQSVSVAKAGLTATLPARAAVLAAANPARGVYDRSRTVHENVKMSPALLSRFDLCFILLDVPDEELDDKLSRHVLAPHGTGGAPRLTEARQELLAHRAHADSDDDDDDDARRKRTRAGASGTSRSQPFDRDADRVSLRRQLRLDLNGADAEFAPLPRGLMRKYVAYAAAYCHPRLTPPAAEVLQEYYLELRARSAAGADVTPITPRQLESLCRLAEARAKVELRETVTRSDAFDAVEIMRESLREVMSGNALGKGFSGKGGKPNKRGKAKLFVDGMNARAREKQSAYFTTGELHALADDLRLELKDVDGFIESLNVAGEILKSGRLYKTASGDL